MAHVEDHWYVVRDGEKVPSARHGRGRRWRVRWVVDGRERSRMFAKKGDADRFRATVEADIARGAYVDPDAGRVTLRQFAEQWLADQTSNESTQEATELRWRLHIGPYLGERELRGIRPSSIRTWYSVLQSKLAPTYCRVIFANLSAILAAAVDDGLIARNPCQARSVRPPRPERRKVQPWPTERVLAVIEALPVRYRPTATLAAGCGLRQGEVFGLRLGDVAFLGRKLRVEQQVKLRRDNRPYFALPKRGKTREVPLPDVVAVALSEHVRAHPPGDDGLIFTSRERKPLNRNHFNSYVWRPALRVVGIEPSRETGIHALRHYYASVLLDAGESIKALAEYLGHSDPGFTLRVYTHLLPASEDRTRRAVDHALGGGAAVDGTATAQWER